jgi:hypothetical protein
MKRMMNALMDAYLAYLSHIGAMSNTLEKGKGVLIMTSCVVKT